MDTEFINLYIDTLIKYSHDLTSKLIIAETKLAYSEKNAASVQEYANSQAEAVETTKNELSIIANDRDTIRTELSTFRQQFDSKVVELEDLRRRLHEVSVERDQLKVEVEKLTPPLIPEIKKNLKRANLEPIEITAASDE